MFRKSIMILLFIPFLIMACATTQTPLKKKLLTNSTPQFNGYITKIYKPIQPMYKPVESNFKLSISMVDLEIPKNSSTKKSTEYLEIAGNCKIEKLGDLLTWEYKLIEVTADGKTTTFKDLPVIGRILADKFGKIQETESMHPNFRDPNISPKKKDASIKWIHKASYYPLPTNPIRSGDPIVKIEYNVSEIDTELWKDFRIYNDGELIIDGWGFFNEKKVMVASINEIIDGTGDEVDVQFKINGYRLYDAETFQIVDGNLSVVILPNPSSNIKGSGKILIHQSAKLKK